MKKISIILALALMIPIFGFSQIVTITKVGDQIKFSGFPVGNGSVSSDTRFNQIYASSVDQILVKGDVIYFVNSGSTVVIAETPFAKISNKQGTTTPDTYVAKLISLGYLDKSSNKFTTETVFSGTNQNGVKYWPDTVGLCMDGFKNLALSGYFTEPQAVNDSIYLQVTNDYGINWVTAYGYNWFTNTTLNQLKQTGAGTTKVAWSFANLNYKYIRVVWGGGDATNTIYLQARKTN
jgi:hypothetical protein